MGVLSRISTLVKSNLNEAISRAENPEKILSQSIEDMRDNLRQARKEVVDTLAQQKVLEKKLVAVNDAVQGWEAKAVSAVQVGDDDLAREALRRKAASQSQSEAMAEQVSIQKDYVESLKTSLAALEKKIDEAKAKKNELIARLRAAKVKEDLIAAREAATGTHKALEDDSAFAAFARMEENILHLEGKVEAMEEMSEAGAPPESRVDLDIEARLKELKAGNTVEDELEAIKRRLSGKTEE